MIETNADEIERAGLMGLITEEEGNLLSIVDLSSDNGEDAIFYDDPDELVLILDPDIIPEVDENGK